VLPASTRRDSVPNLIGSAIALGGAALGVVALWLPYFDPESERRKYFHLDEIADGNAAASNLVSSRLLAESLPGLLFIAIAASCALSVLVAYRGRRTTQGPMIAGWFAIVVATLSGLFADFFSGAPFIQTGTVGPGLGVHAELVAGLLMLVGGLLIRGSSTAETFVIGSAVAVLVALSTSWLAGLGEPLSPYAGMLVSGAPGDTPGGYSEYVAGYCRSLGVERAAVRFEVVPTAEDAARAVAGQRESPWWNAAYEGCLRGFGNKR
jgi:hypothetical protein